MNLMYLAFHIFYLMTVLPCPENILQYLTTLKQHPRGMNMIKYVCIHSITFCTYVRNIDSATFIFRAEFLEGECHVLQYFVTTSYRIQLSVCGH
jgi:hypothetical protein